MDAITLLKERRSVRKYKDQKVDRKTMEEIIEIARWAPSWGNTQIARYTLVENPDVITRFAEEAVNGFSYNIKTLQNAKSVAVLSFVLGKSGKLDGKGEGKENTSYWEAFDAGIALQTFCLASHAKGVATCPFGVINNEIIADIIKLPKDETVAALVVYGYEDGEHAKPTPRKNVEEILRIIE